MADVNFNLAAILGDKNRLEINSAVAKNPVGAPVTKVPGIDNASTREEFVKVMAMGLSQEMYTIEALTEYFRVMEQMMRTFVWPQDVIDKQLSDLATDIYAEAKRLAPNAVAKIESGQPVAPVQAPNNPVYQDYGPPWNGSPPPAAPPAANAVPPWMTQAQPQLLSPTPIPVAVDPTTSLKMLEMYVGAFRTIGTYCDTNVYGTLRLLDAIEVLMAAEPQIVRLAAEHLVQEEGPRGAGLVRIFFEGGQGNG